jgi:hypothetical protein
MESQLGELTNMLKELQAQNSSIQRTLNDNLAVIQDVGVWRPKIDAKVDALHQSVTDLQQKVDLLASQPSVPHIFHGEPSDLTKSTTTHQSVASSEDPQLPMGAGVDMSNRGNGNGVVTTFVPTPVKGAHTFPQTSVPHADSQLYFDMNKAMPQFDFPKFDGKHPKLWKKQCESYFDVYAIHPTMWVKLAIMNFTGSAAFWSQSVESILQRATWSELCSTLCNRFERDQQNQLDRQFFHLKQTHTFQPTLKSLIILSIKS